MMYEKYSVCFVHKINIIFWDILELLLFYKIKLTFRDISRPWSDNTEKFFFSCFKKVSELQLFVVNGKPGSLDCLIIRQSSSQIFICRTPSSNSQMFICGLQAGSEKCSFPDSELELWNFERLQRSWDRSVMSLSLLTTKHFSGRTFRNQSNRKSKSTKPSHNHRVAWVQLP